MKKMLQLNMINWPTPCLIDVGCILNITKRLDYSQLDEETGAPFEYGTAIQLTSQNAIKGSTIRGGWFSKEHEIDHNIVTTGTTIYVEESFDTVADMLCKAGVDIFYLED